ASALWIAVIRCGINIEPDVFHVGKITAQIADHLVAGAFGPEPGTFHHLRCFKLGPMLQNHVEVRVESAGGDDYGFAVNLDGFVLVICRCHTTDSTIFYE